MLYQSELGSRILSGPTRNRGTYKDFRLKSKLRSPLLRFLQFIPVMYIRLNFWAPSELYNFVITCPHEHLTWKLERAMQTVKTLSSTFFLNGKGWPKIIYLLRALNGWELNLSSSVTGRYWKDLAHHEKTWKVDQPSQ